MIQQLNNQQRVALIIYVLRGVGYCSNADLAHTMCYLSSEYYVGDFYFQLGTSSFI